MGFLKPDVPSVPKPDTSLLNQQRRQLKKQKQVEKARKAEATSEVKKRQLQQGMAGRSLLVATSPRGVEKLGGTM